MRARPWPTPPALLSQHRGHLNRYLAWLTPDLSPAVPEGLHPGHGRGIVPGLVFPLAVLGVREASVQFDHGRVLLVDAIPAPSAPARTRERHLPPRLRQPMRPFHVAVIPVLQRRMVASRRSRDEFIQVGAPA